MSKGLTKAIGLFLFLLFIGGTLLIPVIHKLHCEDHAAAGSDTHCPICQVANTSFITTLPLNAGNIVQLTVGIVPEASPVFVSALLWNSAQARAPPVS
jgi:hypothetical protein